MFISNEASQFLRYLMEKRNKHGVRIGYNENSKWGLSKFKLTLDEFKDGDQQIEVNGLPILYKGDVTEHIHRLHITYENGRLGLLDKIDHN